jgi:hypothetical protein
VIVSKIKNRYRTLARPGRPRRRRGEGGFLLC